MWGGHTHRHGLRLCPETMPGASSSPATPTETRSGSSIWHTLPPIATAWSSSRSATSGYFPDHRDGLRFPPNVDRRGCATSGVDLWFIDGNHDDHTSLVALGHGPTLSRPAETGRRRRSPTGTAMCSTVVGRDDSQSRCTTRAASRRLQSRPTLMSTWTTSTSAGRSPVKRWVNTERGESCGRGRLGWRSSPPRLRRPHPSQGATTPTAALRPE